jgi:hypothetical protein
MMKVWKGLALFTLATVVLAAMSTAAEAQPRRSGAARSVPGGFEPHFELSATYGSMWGGNINLSYGYDYRKLRTGTGGSLGFALDYQVHPLQAVELSYTRQDGSLDLDYRGIRTLTPMSVNFWHIGSLRYLAPGKVKPFVLGSLGLTYFSPANATIQLDEDDPSTVISTQTATKFSLCLGLGLKAYFGEAERFGIRASLKVLPTLYNTGAGLWFGSGGAGVSFGGNAIWQWEAAAGLTVKFGG